MFTEFSSIITTLSATGFLTLAFSSGILYQKVQAVREDLEKFIKGKNYECDNRHRGDSEILKAITKLSTQVETLIANHEIIRSRIDHALEKAIKIESH